MVKQTSEKYLGTILTKLSLINLFILQDFTNNDSSYSIVEARH